MNVAKKNVIFVCCAIIQRFSLLFFVVVVDLFTRAFKSFNKEELKEKKDQK